MKIKNKIDQDPIPDHSTQNGKVLIGISGSVDSLVAAYLLKFQKYDLVAVTVVNVWEEALGGDTPTNLACHLSEEKIKSIKEFCHKINIPHQIIRIGDEFMEKVADVWVTDHLQGKWPKHCLRCEELKLSTLLHKMRELGASRIATGHYAKIFQAESGGPYLVHTSNDPQHDHSASLCHLSQDILSCLLLPLSDLTKKEALVLAENFGIQQDISETKMSECLSLSPDLFPFLEKRISNDLRLRMGINNNSEKPIGLNLLEKMNSSTRVDNKAWVMNCHIMAGLHMSDPVIGCLVTKDHLEVECWIYPKTASTFYLEFSESLKLMSGEIVSVIKKKGKNSKVFFTGEIKLLPVVEEGEQSVTKVDPALDF